MPLFVYVMASGRNGTLYIGVTNDLARRAFEHRSGAVDGFSKKYGTKLLVYYEAYETPREAIEREKRFKKWNRKWKLRVIEAFNPDWRDLWDDLNA